MATVISTHTSLLARLAEGRDQTAWREFSDRYGELIRGFARRRGLQPADCDDVAQEVLLSLSKAMRGFEYDPGKGKFRAYLKATTLRAISRTMCQKRGGADLDTIEKAARAAERDDTAEEAWEIEWRAHHARRAMRVVEAEFNRTDLRAFQRYAVEGLGAQATAAALGLNVDQVYQAKSRIMRRLAQLVELQVEDEG